MISSIPTSRIPRRAKRSYAVERIRSRAGSVRPARTVAMTVSVSIDRKVCLLVDIPLHLREGFEIEVIRKRRALLREVNEQIRRTHGSFGAAESYLLLCECEDADCRGRFEVPARVYDAVRRDSDRFLVIAGHEDADVDRIVAGDGYCVVRVRPAARRVQASSPLPAV